MSEFSKKVSKQTDQKLLNAISKLKRVVGAPNDKAKADCVTENNGVKIYSTDRDSAIILHALFHQFLHGNKPVYYFDENNVGIPVPLCMPEVVQNGNDVTYEIKFAISEGKRPQFISRLEAYIEQFLKPDNVQQDPEATTPSPNGSSRGWDR